MNFNYNDNKLANNFPFDENFKSFTIPYLIYNKNKKKELQNLILQLDESLFFQDLLYITISQNLEIPRQTNQSYKRRLEQ